MTAPCAGELGAEGARGGGTSWLILVMTMDMESSASRASTSAGSAGGLRVGAGPAAGSTLCLGRMLSMGPLALEEGEWELSRRVMGRRCGLVGNEESREKMETRCGCTGCSTGNSDDDDCGGVMKVGESSLEHI